MVQTLIKDNRYNGKYVAIKDFNDSIVIGEGATPQEAYDRAFQKGFTHPVITFVPIKNSISANISEGFGRYFKKGKINFYRYSYGSVEESFDWIEKANKRSLLKENEYQHISEELKKLPREINSLIKFTNERLSI